MSGFLQGFEGGFGMTDRVMQQHENKRRYGLQQERLNRAESREIERYDAAQARQGKLDAMNEQLHDIQVEQSEYNKTQRPILEQRAQEQHDSLMANHSLNREAMKLTLKERRKEMKMKDVMHANNILSVELSKTGKISAESLQMYYETTKGTVFEVDYMLDKNVMKSVDALTTYAKNGFANTNTQEVLGHFNTVFKQDINKLMVHENAAYNKVTQADAGKDGQMSFGITAYDQNGKPLDTRYFGDVLNYSAVVDKTFAVKAAMASMLANPKLKAQLEAYGGTAKQLEKQGGLDYVTKNNISQAQRLYQDILKNAEEQKQAIREKYADPMAINLDQTQMQAELDAINQWTQQSIQGLHDNFSPQEINYARIPSPVANKGIGQADPNAKKQSALDSLNKHLKDKGLAPVTVEGE